MNNNAMRTKFIIFLLHLIILQPCWGTNSTSINGSNTVLIITSYNPDTKRMSGFINDFEKAVQKNGYGFNILIENMGFRGLDESNTWTKAMHNVLTKYNSQNLMAIILLGQEAWVSFLNQENYTCDIPFYACFASPNSTTLPANEPDRTWDPQYVDAIKLSKKIGNGGGYLNSYSVEGNIRLILSIYPSIKNIALITDNSYGGVSLQAFVKHKMSRMFPDLNLILLDTRKNTTSEIRYRIATLPPNTAMLLGTWRIDMNGLYFSQSTISDIIPNNTHLPVFSLSGMGIGSVAIGGQVPDYDVDANKIATDIYNFKTHNHPPTIFWTNNSYIFDRIKIKEFGINEYQLPKGSIIQDELADKLRQSQRNIYLITSFATLLAILSTGFYMAIKRLKAQGRELMLAKNRAEESERLKSLFLANMSHEIRTPLNAIVGFSEMLIATADEQERQEYGKIISSNSDMLLNLINDILDLSKIESGHMDFTNTNVEMIPLFDNLYNVYKLKMPADVMLYYKAPQNDYTVSIDKQRVSQVVTNFITNAIKFTQKGSITIGHEYTNNGIHIFVTDTGIGIEKNDVAKIFNRFEKLNPFIQGTGLGLPISKAIVESANGKIGVDSTLGEGSTFWAWIPCKLVSQARADSYLDGLSKNNWYSYFNKASSNILVAEDDDSNFMLINLLLEGYTVDRANNGREAVNKLMQKEYSIVLMDIKMPLMDGIEATKKIREFNEGIPIIAVTANAFETDKLTALEAGCNDYITKPIKKDVLLKKIITFTSTN